MQLVICYPLPSPPAKYKPFLHLQEFEKSCLLPRDTRLLTCIPSQPMPILHHTIFIPNLHLSLCVWKPLKCYAMCFIANGNLLSGSFQSQQKPLKTLKKNVNPFGQPSLSFKGTVEKEYVVHWQTLKICSPAIHDMSRHTKYLFTSSASCRHTECISCNTIKNWKLQHVVFPPLNNVCTPLYHKLSVVLNFFLMSLSHALESSFS